MTLNVIFKNKETQQEEVGELRLQSNDIACLYRDQYGTFVVTFGGKSYKVTQTLEQLQELL